MKFASLSIVSSIFASALFASGECGDSHAMERLALQHAVKKNRHIVSSDVYSLKEMKGSDGYAYLFYFNIKSGGDKAYTVLVTMDKSCNIRYVQENPIESDLKLVMN